MTKSTLYLIDAEDQLSKMKLAETEDPKTHLSKLQKHFKTMVLHWDNLIKMGSSTSDTHFNTLIMSSLPEFHCPTLQTITASKWASKLSGQSHCYDFLTYYSFPARLLTFFPSDMHGLHVVSCWLMLHLDGCTFQLVAQFSSAVHSL